MTPSVDTPHWEQIKDIKAPFPSTDPKEFGYWFNYFWEEARQSAMSRVEKFEAAQAFHAVRTVTKEGKVPPDDQKLGKLSFLEQRKILEILLKVGFKKVAMDGTNPPSKTSGTVARAVDAGMVFAIKMSYNQTSGTQGTVSLGFRADGRTYADLEKQTGLKARARSKGQGIYTIYGLDKPWNPFSLDQYSNCLFLRKGINKDNCLHTVVSVATEFAEILPYPLLSDASLFKWANTDLAKWTKQDEQEALAHKFQVRSVRKTPNDPIDHLESEIRVFVLRMDDSKAFSTKDWQKEVGVTNPFPEAAVDEIGISNILAEIEITRKHFFDSGDLTFYDFDFKEVRLVPSETVLKSTFGDHFPKQLQTKIEQLKNGARGVWAGARSRYEKARSAPTGPGKGSAKQECPHCKQLFSPVQLKMHVNNCPMKK